MSAGVGQQVRVLVEAVDPGIQGNVPALTINEIEGPLNITLRVSNPSPASGGTVEVVPVVTQADKDRVLGQLQVELQQQAYAQLAESLQQGELVPAETVRTFTLAETYDRFNGEPADVLGLQLQLPGPWSGRGCGRGRDPGPPFAAREYARRPFSVRRKPAAWASPLTPVSATRPSPSPSASTQRR